MKMSLIREIQNIDAIFTTIKNGKKICTTPYSKNGFLEDFKYLTKTKNLNKSSQLYLCENKNYKSDIIKIWMKNIFDNLRLQNKTNGFTISLDGCSFSYIDYKNQIELELSRIFSRMSHYKIIRLLKSLAFGHLVVYFASSTRWNVIASHVDFAERIYNRYKDSVHDGPITHYIVGIIGNNDVDLIYIDGLDLSHIHNTLPIIKKAFKVLQQKIRRVCKIRKTRFLNLHCCSYDR